jgi:hypothetical protein
MQRRPKVIGRRNREEPFPSERFVVHERLVVSGQQKPFRF